MKHDSDQLDSKQESPEKRARIDEPLNLVGRLGGTDGEPSLRSADNRVEGCPLCDTLDKKGQDVDLQDVEVKKAWLEAAENGQNDLIPHLLTKHDAKIEGRDKDGNTALLLAAGEGHNDTVDLLLEHGASVEAKNNNGYTALLLAALNGHNDTVDLLLEHGVSLDDRNIYDETALLLAVKEGCNDIVEHLLAKYKNKFKLDEKDAYGNTALLLAARYGHNDTVDLLLEHGASLDDKNNDGDTALTLAAFNGQKDTVKHLLVKHKNKLKLEDKDSYGNTALLLAARKGHNDTIDLLLEHGASLDDTDNDGDTALILADSEGHHDTVSLLIQKHHVNINYDGDFWDYDSLIRSAKQFFKAVVKNDFAELKRVLDDMPEAQKKLVVHWPVNDGSDTTSATIASRKTALGLAYEAKDMDVMSLLLAHGASIEEDMDEVDVDGMKNQHLLLSLARNDKFSTIDGKMIYSNLKFLEEMVSKVVKGEGPYVEKDLALLLDFVEGFVTSKYVLTGENSITCGNDSIVKGALLSRESRAVAIRFLLQLSQVAPERCMPLLSRFSEEHGGFGLTGVFDGARDREDLFLCLLDRCEQLNREKSPSCESVVGSSLAVGQAEEGSSEGSGLPLTPLYHHQSQDEAMSDRDEAELAQSSLNLSGAGFSPSGSS